MIHNIPNQPSKLKTTNWFEINDQSLGTYNKDNQIRFKTSRLSLYDHSNAFTLVKGTITVAQETAEAPNNANKKAIFKNCAPFTNCISRINIMQVDDAYDIDVVM